MKYSTWVLFSFCISIANADPVMILSFENQKSEPSWKAVNDGVMGGLSEGKPEVKDGSLHFSGNLSLENNGGFSSIRTVSGAWDMTAAKGITLRIKGDGRIYQLRLATDTLYRGSPISYGVSFETVKNEWKNVFIPFSEMKPSWRGRSLDGPELNLSKINEIGILLGDKKAGEFKLEVDWLKSVAK